jgi:hypothetical protein
MAKTLKKTFRISGHVIDGETHQGMPGLLVEAWDRGGNCKDRLGSAQTGNQGLFEIKVDETSLRKLFVDERSEISFKVFRENKLLNSTEQVGTCDDGFGETEILVESAKSESTELASCTTPEVRVVHGRVREKSGVLARGLRVRAFRKLLRSEEPLCGTAIETVTDDCGNYQISYTVEETCPGERNGIGVVLHVTDTDGNEWAVSKPTFPIYDTPEQATVDLVVVPPAEARPPEYERVLRSVTPALQRERVELTDLTKDDIPILASNTGIDRQRIEYVAQAARHSRESGLPAAVYYGCACQGLDSDRLLSAPPAAVSQALTAAIAENQIPAMIGELLGQVTQRLNQLRAEHAAPISHDFVGQLLNQNTNAPLPGLTVRAFDMEAGAQPKALGYDVTNGRGIFAFAYATVRTSSPTEQRRLRLNIFDREGKEIHQTEVTVKVAENKLVEVRIPGPVVTEPSSPKLAELSAAVNLELPRQLTTFLTQQSIHTLEDIRKVGGINHLEGLPVAPDHPAVQALEAHANLNFLSSNLQFNAAMIAKGYPSLYAVANASRKDFVIAMHDQVGDFKAAQLQVSARAINKQLNNSTMELKSAKANGFEVQTPADQLPGLAHEFDYKCGCEDCQAAISPMAYLADLLNYTVNHLLSDGLPISLQFLTDKFHQPFGDLSTDCDEVHKQVRQVRICIEVLRSYLNSSLPAPVEKKYLLAAYTALLSKIGASYEEIRLARTAEIEDRRALADRLGFDFEPNQTDRVVELILDPNIDDTQPQAITEKTLEKLFGLVDTTRDPLSGGAKFSDLPGQIPRWNLKNVEWGRHTDNDGMVYVSLKRQASNFRVEFYRDKQRTELVASGERSSSNGIVQLFESAGGPLSGSFDIAYQYPSNAIEISVVPCVLSWRLQHLRSQWKEQDWPTDLYTDDSVPIIDPDIIGPDDFRSPFAKTDQTGSDQPFDIWLQRRGWVDQTLNAFRKALTVDKLDKVLADNLEKPTTLEALLADLTEGAAHEKSKSDLEKLGLTAESFTRLMAIRVKDQRASTDPKAKKVTPEEKEELASILTQHKKLSFFNAWRNEEKTNKIRFDAKIFWASLHQPKQGQWPPLFPEPPQQRPVIDPEILTRNDLPEPVLGAEALAFWDARQGSLKKMNKALKAERETKGLESMIELALGAAPNPPDDWLQSFQKLYNELTGGTPDVVAQAQAQIQDNLHMSPEDFTRLVIIVGKDEPALPEWEEVYGILTTAKKEKENSPIWIAEEQKAGFHSEYWRALKAMLPRWRATAEARHDWEQALQNRTQSPIIDPDLINIENLRDPLADLPAFKLWQDRSNWITAQLDTLKNETAAAVTALNALDSLIVENLIGPEATAGSKAELKSLREKDGLDNVLTQLWGDPLPELDTLLANLASSSKPVAAAARKTIATSLYLSPENFTQFMPIRADIKAETATAPELETVDAILTQAMLVKSVMLLNREQNGNDFSARLDQLDLPAQAFTHLFRTRELIAGSLPGETPLLPSEWDEIFSIFVQIQKRRAFAEWREAEQTSSLLLGPDLFQIPETAAVEFPPENSTTPSSWRAALSDRSHWEDTLQSRIDQQKETVDGFGEAIDAAEGAVLQILRDALVRASNLKGTDVDEKADSVGNVLLIDAKNSTCQKTTRVAQAIETIQNLIFSVRTNQLDPTFKLSLNEDDSFDEEWKWMGSYSAWRAAMLVFIYPENLLIPSLRPIELQTPAFRALLDVSRNNRSFDPEAACKAACDYEAYFLDVCDLIVEATCTAKTRVSDADSCNGTKASAEGYRDLFYMFARSKKTKNVYYSTVDVTAQADDPQSFWQGIRLGLFGSLKADQLIASVVYEPTSEERWIYLFMQVTIDGKPQLRFIRWDLEQPGWMDEPVPLESPMDQAIDDVVAVQGMWTNEPPQLALRLGQDVYIRALNHQGNAWGTEPTVKKPDSTEIYGEWDLYRVVNVRHFVVPPEGPIGVYKHPVIKQLHAAFWDPFSEVAGGGLSDYVLWITDDNETSATFASLRPDWYGSQTNLVETYSGKCIDAVRDSAGPIKMVFYDLDGSVHVMVRWGTDPYEDFAHVANLMRVVPSVVPAVDYSVKTHFVYELSGGQSGYYHFTLGWEPGFIPKEVSRSTVAPTVDVSDPLAFALTNTLSSAELQEKRTTIEKLYETTVSDSESSRSNLIYLKEMYYFVPIQLALQLQRNGYYDAALNWYRSVFDYAAPIGRQQKIYYGLVEEESFSPTYQRIAEWLLAPLNPHAIAGTRSDTYTRFTVLAIVRCLIEYADSEFTLDTVESIPRARTLYLTALRLLDLKWLKQRLHGCDDLIGTLEIDIKDPLQAWVFQLIEAFTPLSYFKQLDLVVGKIKGILAGDGTWESRFMNAQKVISSARAALPITRRIVDIVEERASTTAKTQAALLVQPEVSASASNAGGLAAKTFLETVSRVSGVPTATLEQDKVELPWLWQNSSFGNGKWQVPMFQWNAADPFKQQGIVTAHKPSFPAPYTPSTPPAPFCIPPNPELKSLRFHAETNLFKLRHCRNIAGLLRYLEPYSAPVEATSGLPFIAADSQLVIPGVGLATTPRLLPTVYRYAALIERAKQLVNLSQQIETAFFSAVEKTDAARYSLLKARQDERLARSGSVLQDLRVAEASAGVRLAESQRDRAQIQVDHYQSLIDIGPGEAGEAVLPAANFFVSALSFNFSGAISAQERLAAMQTSEERTVQDWEYQLALAQQDVGTASEQIVIAQDHVAVTKQESFIAQIQADFSEAVVDFLSNQFFNVELYDWMSTVLERVYRFFLQQATATAQMASNQLAFERQETPPAFIQADYWEVPDGVFSTGHNTSGPSPDRRGLTGSARLLQDIYQLDQYAFSTNQRKLQLTKTISLARMAPLEFQRFRETGFMLFATPMELFDRDFPGHYLRLVKRVRTSIIALIPPSQGIRATLSTSGISRVVVGGDLFQTTVIKTDPQSVALSSPVDSTGLFNLDQQSEILNPFEASGVDTTWELRMPKAANSFDYSTIADVLITVDYTALASLDYQQQVLQLLEPTVSLEQPFSFRNQFADQWYDLHNPDQTGSPMTVQFVTVRQDFPPNLDDLKIKHVSLYFSRTSSESMEISVDLRFTEQNRNGSVGGSATTSAGIISTRMGNAGAWYPIIGRSPIGEWELALPNRYEIRDLFESEKISEMLFVLTVSGSTPAWPE